MYKCNNCGCEFEEPRESREYHGLDYGYETFWVCPNCGDNDYNEAKVCDICGGEHFGDDNICEWCLAEAIGELRMLHKTNYTNVDIFDFIDLFTMAIDNIYVEERSKRRK